MFNSHQEFPLTSLFSVVFAQTRQFLLCMYIAAPPSPNTNDHRISLLMSEGCRFKSVHPATLIGSIPLILGRIVTGLAGATALGMTAGALGAAAVAKGVGEAIAVVVAPETAAGTAVGYR